MLMKIQLFGKMYWAPYSVARTIILGARDTLMYYPAHNCCPHVAYILAEGDNNHDSWVNYIDCWEVISILGKIQWSIGDWEFWGRDGELTRLVRTGGLIEKLAFEPGLEEGVKYGEVGEELRRAFQTAGKWIQISRWERTWHVQEVKWRQVWLQ